MRTFDRLTLGLAFGLALPFAADADAPERVVSINLCTDQLAILLAAPGQLVSVYYLAQDPRSSVMVKEAQAFDTNNGLAEEVYLLKPDLVLAGTYTSQATVSMLRRLGIEVAVFPPANSLADVRQGMLDVGKALGRDAEAAGYVARYDAALARIDLPQDPRPSAATYAANGYTAGSQSLSGDIILAAGFYHLAAEYDLPFGGFLPLEALVMSNPDLVIKSATYPGKSRADEVLSHPALGVLTGGQTVMQDKDWVCGLPSVIDAVDRLATARKEQTP